jgi:hypothetical protein
VPSTTEVMASCTLPAADHTCPQYSQLADTPMLPVLPARQQHWTPLAAIRYALCTVMQRHHLPSGAWTTDMAAVARSAAALLPTNQYPAMASSNRAISSGHHRHTALQPHPQQGHTGLPCCASQRLQSPPWCHLLLLAAPPPQPKGGQGPRPLLPTA